MPASFIKNLLEELLYSFRNSPMHGEAAHSLNLVRVADLRGAGSVCGGTKLLGLQRPFGPLSLPRGRRGPRLSHWPLFKRTTPDAFQVWHGATRMKGTPRPERSRFTAVASTERQF